MDLQLAGRRALITGASQGIGEGLAEAFAREGVNLLLVARNEVRLLAVKTRLSESYGVAVEILPGDLTAPGVIDAIAAVAGDVDILVKNAGRIPGGSL